MHDPRSYTETLTNLVVLSTFDIGRHFGEILQRDLPIGTLPTFLHEATHHWCLDTSVGIALHLLGMRARRAALAAHGESATRDDGWNVLDSVVRYEFVRDFMRPLSEGVALFAEHDAIPGDARTISTPLVMTTSLYGRVYGFSGDKPWENLPYVLAAARVSRAHGRRKAGLLLEAMNCDKGGYLPGYLLVKSLWQIAHDASKAFYDADFFLQYLRAYLFDDWGLVARLLDDDVKDIGATSAIAQHIADRLAQFVKVAIHGDHPKRFETLLHDNRFETMKIDTEVMEIDLGFLPIEQGEDAALGRKRLSEGLRAHFASWFDDEDQDALLVQDRAELVQRSVINLGQVSAQATFDDEGLQLRLQNGERTGIPAELFAMRLRINDQPLTIDFLVAGNKGELCALLTNEGDVVALLPLGVFKVPDSIKNTVMTLEERSTYVKYTEELIDSALRRTDTKKYYESSRRETAKQLNDWFMPLALTGVPLDRVPAIRTCAAQNGLLELLGHDPGLLLDAAVASLCVPSPYNFNSVASFHTWSAGSPSESIDRINERISATLGFEPFLIGDDGVFRRISFI